MTITERNIHKGDVGTILQITIRDDRSNPISLPSNTTLVMTLEKPDGTQITRTPVFVTDGTDGIISYTTITGDIDASGEWKLQVNIVAGAAVWNTEVFLITILANL